MATSNEDYRDAALRHAVGIRRYTSGLTKRVSDLLAQAEIALVEKLRARLPRFENNVTDFTSDRWKLLLADIREARGVAMQQYKDLTRSELGTLSTQEAAQELASLQAVVPIEINFATVAADQLRAIVSSKPFQGRLLKDWFKTLEAADQTRLVQTIQLGLSQGETTDEIVRTVVGTRAQAYTDGVLAISRRDAQAIVRTAINHVSNTAREYVWEANADIITARIWHSTLDGRTSPICRARDGLAAPVGDNELPAGLKALSPPSARPPAHISCRSVMVAYIDGVALVGDRPFVSDTRGRKEREADFREIAAEQGKTLQQVRQQWASTNIGRVPASTTYEDFLRRQSVEFQEAVLGKTKAKLFRDGKLSVKEFVDRGGNELNLAQLAATKPEAFRLADLDPEDFGG